MLAACLLLLVSGLPLGTGSTNAFVPTTQARFKTHMLRGSVCALRGVAPHIASYQGAHSHRVRQITMHRGDEEDSERMVVIDEEDTERIVVTAVKSAGQWNELMAKVADTGSMVVILFSKEYCRKCAAMKPKFAKIARDYSDRDLSWAEVDGVKLGKELRVQLNLSKVPSFQIWRHGKMLETFDADMDLQKTVDVLMNHVDKHAGGRTDIAGGANELPSNTVLLRDLLQSRSSL